MANPLANVWRLFRVFLRIGIQTETAYRANFWFQALESTIGLGTALGAILVVFSQTETLAGWHQPELLAVLGVYFLVIGAIVLVIAPSLQKFMEDVQQGTFDYTLTKPADAQLLVSLSEVRIFKLLDVALGVGVLTVALSQMTARVGVIEAASFGAALLAGGAIVYSFWLFLATLSFWFIRVENIVMVFWSMYWAARWPVGIYPTWLRITLTVVVPVAFAVTVPVEALAGRATAGTLALAAGLGAASLVASRWFWKRGLRAYAGASA